MRKILLISSILIGGIFTAQNKKIDKIYSTKELILIQKSIPENEKKEFYTQFFKANLFENIKQKFSYKKYPENLLQKFTDSIMNYHHYDASDFKTEEEKIMSFEEFEKNENDGEIRNKASMEKLKKENPEMYKMMVGFENQLKPQIKGTMKEKYEKYISDIKQRNENDPFLEKNRKKVIENLNQQFSSKNYFSQETQDLLLKNIDIMPNQLFPIPASKHENEGEIYEVIPNDILAFEMNNGLGAGRYTVTYKILNDKLLPLEVFPTENDKNFEQKVTKYLKQGFRFEPRTGYEMKKNKNGEYIISTAIFLDEDANCCPSKAIEYKTKDFRKFVPLRLLQNFEKPTWTKIK